MNLTEPFFSQIQDGRKTWELRLNDSKRQSFRIGDTLVFTEPERRRTVRTVIVEKRTGRSFRELLEDVGVRQTIPDANSIDEAVAVYEKIYGPESQVDDDVNKLVSKHENTNQTHVAFRVVVNPNPRTHDLPFINSPDCPLFDYIIDGVKRVEGRTNAAKYREYRPGDRLKIMVTGPPDQKGRSCLVLITDIIPYYDVEEYLIGEGFVLVSDRKISDSSEESCYRNDQTYRLAALPCLSTIREGVAMYNRWTTPEKRAAIRADPGSGGMAFLAIRIAVLDN